MERAAWAPRSPDQELSPQPLARQARGAKSRTSRSRVAFIPDTSASPTRSSIQSSNGPPTRPPAGTTAASTVPHARGHTRAPVSAVRPLGVEEVQEVDAAPSVREIHRVARLPGLRQIDVAERPDLVRSLRSELSTRVDLGQRLDSRLPAGPRQPSRRRARVRAISPWFRSKILIGRLMPNPIVLSGPMRWYSICGVMSHQALARARLMSARAFSRAACAARTSGRFCITPRA